MKKKRKRERRKRRGCRRREKGEVGRGRARIPLVSNLLLVWGPITRQSENPFPSTHPEAVKVEGKAGGRETLLAKHPGFPTRLNVVAWPTAIFFLYPSFHNIPTSGVCRMEFRRTGLKNMRNPRVFFLTNNGFLGFLPTHSPPSTPFWQMPTSSGARRLTKSRTITDGLKINSNHL